MAEKPLPHWPRLKRGSKMSAICITSVEGTYYTKEYETPARVREAIERGEELTYFWFSGWGRKFTETFLFAEATVSTIRTEREI